MIDVFAIQIIRTHQSGSFPSPSQNGLPGIVAGIPYKLDHRLNALALKLLKKENTSLFKTVKAVSNIATCF